MALLQVKRNLCEVLTAPEVQTFSLVTSSQSVCDMNSPITCIFNWACQRSRQGEDGAKRMTGWIYLCRTQPSSFFCCCCFGSATVHKPQHRKTSTAERRCRMTASPDRNVKFYDWGRANSCCRRLVLKACKRHSLFVQRGSFSASIVDGLQIRLCLVVAG